MRLATWNVDSLVARLPRVLEFLAAHRPDVACLQETRCSEAGFPVAELGAMGYESVDGCAGVALLVRAGVAVEGVREGVPAGDGWGEGRWLEAVVEGVRVVSVHVPEARAGAELPANSDVEPLAAKLSFLSAAAERVREVSGNGPLVLAGTVEVCAEDRDLYDPAAFAGASPATAEERAALAALRSAGGLRDAFRDVHPIDPGFTWWDHHHGHFHRRLGLRLDQVLVTEPLSVALRGCAVDRNFRTGRRPSDHAPVIAEWTTAS